MKMRKKYLESEATAAPVVERFDPAPLLAEIEKLRKEVCDGHAMIEELQKELARDEKPAGPWSFDVRYDASGRIVSATASQVGEPVRERNIAVEMYG